MDFNRRYNTIISINVTKKVVQTRNLAPLNGTTIMRNTATGTSTMTVHSLLMDTTNSTTAAEVESDVVSSREKKPQRGWRVAPRANRNSDSKSDR